MTQGASMPAVAALTGEFPRWEHEADEVQAQEQRPEIMAQHEAAKASLSYPV